MDKGKNYSSLAAAGIIIVVLVLPLLITNKYYVHILQSVGIVCILAYGLNILFGYTGQISLGHAGLYAIGAYTTGLLTVKLGLSPWLGILLSMAVCAIFGLVLAGLALRVRGPYLAMVTIAFGLAIERAVTEWQSLTGGPQGIAGIPVLSINGYTLDSRGYLYLIIVLSIVFYFFAKHLVESRWGRAFLGLSASEVAAESLGINVYRYKVLSFVASSVCAGLAGALFAHQNEYINSEIFNLDLSIFFLIVVLFGGLATPTGPIIGSIVLVISQELFNELYNYHLYFYGGILLFSLMVLPQGVAGGVRNLLRRGQALGAKEVRGITALEVPRFIQVDNSAIADASILRASKLSRFFGGIKANVDIDMAVQKNSIHALIGPNGSGKTTFLNVVSGFYRPTSGRIFLDNIMTSSMTSNQIARAGIGRTFQNVQVFGDMTVLDNVKVGFHSHTSANMVKCLCSLPSFKREEKWVEEEALALMEFTGISDFSRHTAKNLSHGHQRLLGIARALAIRPRLLLLDEPAAGLVQQEIQFLKELILKVRNAGITVLLVEHHMDLVMDISDTVTVLDYGEKIAEGTPKEVQTNARVIQAYLGNEEV